MSTIGIIGPGRLGASLGRRWAEAGHAIRYGVREPDDARYDQVRDHATVTSATAAVGGADVVVIAVPWSAALELAGQLTEVDAVVVDATNPLAGGRRHDDLAPELSGTERLAGLMPHARLVKAFNTTGAGNVASTAGYPAPPLMLIAGDDAAAKELVSGLAAQLGLAPEDAGGLAAARDLEHLALVWIRLAYTLGHGPDFSFALQHRAAP